MRKAARKQKKLENEANQAPKISTNSGYYIPPCKDIEVYTDRWQISDELNKIVLLNDDEVRQFAGALIDNKTVQSLTTRDSSVELMKCLAEAMKFNTSLQLLRIWNTGWRAREKINKHLEHISTLVKNCVSLPALSLEISSASEHTSDSFVGFTTALKCNTTLTELTLPALTYDRLDHIELLIEAINEHPKLVDVAFQHGGKNTIDGMQLMGKLIAIKRLKRICFETQHPFQPGSCLAIFEALKENNSLTDLSLAKINQPAGPSGFSEKECDLLCEALNINQTLTRLNINGNRLGSENTSKILYALQHNKSIAEFHFSDNILNSDIAPSLAGLLEANETLTELDLPNSHLTDQACKILAPALQKNRTITSLNLFMNKFGPEGCKAIAEGLKFNKALVRINLKDCQIGDEGCIYLGEAIKTNQCLLHLDISGQDIKIEGFTALVGGLKENDSLTDLTASKAKSVPQELYDEIIRLQKNNKRYQRELIVNTITLLIQIARSDAFDLFPLEIWLRIFKHFICGGVPEFNYIAEAILMNMDVRDLPALCKMKIVRINGKSHLVPKK